MKNDFTIFRYSTMLALTRAGITTFAELEKMSNAEIANNEILQKLGRQSGSR